MITARQKPKRKYGEGSIYQRKDGRWVAKFKGEGMTKPRVVYAKSEPEAKRKLRELKKDAAKGVVKNGKVCFCDYAERWLYTFKRYSVESSTFDKYESVYLTHIKPVFGRQPLASIQGEQLQNLLTAKSLTHSYNLAKKIKMICKELFTYAHSENDIPRNPMQNVKMPKKSLFKPERVITAMERDEVLALEQVAEMKHKNGVPQIMHANVMVFLAHTGLRCGELQALKWSDIDFERQTVTVNKNLTLVYDRERDGTRTNRRKVQIKGTKTASGNRTVPLNNKAIAALHGLKAIYREKGIKSPYVVVTRNGKVPSNNQLSVVLQRVLKLADIDKKFTLHQLRHTFATQTLKAGVPVTVVSKWLGHANVSITYSTYIHALQSEELASIELLQAM